MPSKSQSEIWDDLYGSNLKWKLEARNLPNILKNKKVLELGVGNGKTLRSILNQNPKEVYALDFSEEAIKIVKKEFPTVKSVKSDVVKMPFQDKEFEVIVCYFTLNNLLKKDRQKAVNEIYRVLKDKGIMIFQDFAVGDFREGLSEKTKETHTIQKSNGIICHFFDEKEFKELFSKFKKFKIQNQISKPIKNKPHLERKLIFAEIEK